MEATQTAVPYPAHDTDTDTAPITGAMPGDTQPDECLINPWVRLPTMKRILLVEDEIVVIDSLKRLVGWLSPQSNVVQAGSLAQTRERLESLEPFDMVILDLELPDASRLEALIELKALDGQAHIIVLSGNCSALLEIQCRQAGAHEVLHKTYRIGTLVESLREQLQIAGPRGEATDAGGATAPPVSINGVKLTRRLYQVLELLAEGCTNKTIATRMRISGATVKTHLHRLYELLGVRCRAQAIALLYKERGRL